MSEYPKTDKEIRMYCLEYIRPPFSDINAQEAVKDANTIYQFICPKRKGLKARLQELILSKQPIKNKKYDYWYLREGDFRPEHISECFNGSGVWNERGLKLFKEAGNLFLTKEEATIASEKVREFLCSINNPWCL